MSDSTSSCSDSCHCATSTASAPTTTGTHISEFQVAKMDCGAEERLVRLALEGMAQVRGLTFDLPRRELQVYHDGAIDPVTDKLLALGLGAQWQSTTEATAETAKPTPTSDPATAAREGRTLRLLLAINAAMFALELIAGWIAESTGLIADSLDMFADAAVYGVALWCVGKGAQMQLRSARLAGGLQLALAIGLLFEVVRRLLFGSEPLSSMMIGVSAIALVANISCLWMLSPHKEGGAHMRASWIFSANDVLANIGVIAAGILVAVTGSRYPDLIIGTVVGVLVLHGARRILALRA